MRFYISAKGIYIYIELSDMQMACFFFCSRRWFVYVKVCVIEVPNQDFFASLDEHTEQNCTKQIAWVQLLYAYRLISFGLYLCDAITQTFVFFLIIWNAWNSNPKDTSLLYVRFFSIYMLLVVNLFDFMCSIVLLVWKYKLPLTKLFWIGFFFGYRSI